MENKKLPEDFKRKWVAALRSGEYKQGSGHLKNGNYYCCLGVAYKVATGHEPDRQTQICENHLDYENVPEILIWNKQQCPKEKQDLLNGLAERNDNGITFDDIADYIEENL